MRTFLSLVLIITSLTIFHLTNGTAFDDYVLALTWPNTFCLSNRCIQPKPNTFTVHGLWPSNRTTIVQRCAHPIALDLHTIQTRWNCSHDLHQYWPNLNSNLPSRTLSFWQYEWDVHGTCSRLSQEDYFYTTMELYKEFKVMNLLRDLQTISAVVPARYPHSGQSPPPAYALATLQAAFNNTLGERTKDIYIHCTAIPILDDRHRIIYHQFLSEVHVYIDPKTMTRISSPKTSKCGSYVYFPN